jgi:transcriptional regulator with XRE-family HTH domain
MRKRSIVDQLRKAIEKSGETQYSLSKATGVDQSVLSRFLHGERTISLETAARLCKHLGLELKQVER